MFVDRHVRHTFANVYDGGLKTVGKHNMHCAYASMINFTHTTHTHTRVPCDTMECYYDMTYIVISLLVVHVWLKIFKNLYNDVPT